MWRYPPPPAMIKFHSGLWVAHLFGTVKVDFYSGFGRQFSAFFFSIEKGPGITFPVFYWRLNTRNNFTTIHPAGALWWARVRACCVLCVVVFMFKIQQQPHCVQSSAGGKNNANTVEEDSWYSAPPAPRGGYPRSLFRQCWHMSIPN